MARVAWVARVARVVLVVLVVLVAVRRCDGGSGGGRCGSAMPTYVGSRFEAGLWHMIYK